MRFKGYRHTSLLRWKIFLYKYSLMEEMTVLKPPYTAEEQFDKRFKPKGAIAFFVLLIILGLIIWFGIFIIMLNRS